MVGQSGNLPVMTKPALDPSERLVVRTIRITQLQEARLRRLMQLDGLPINEHIRRGLDGYLNAMERAQTLPPIAAAPQPSAHA